MPAPVRDGCVRGIFGRSDGDSPMLWGGPTRPEEVWYVAFEGVPGRNGTSFEDLGL
jgi:hypothetical protein